MERRDHSLKEVMDDMQCIVPLVDEDFAKAHAGLRDSIIRSLGIPPDMVHGRSPLSAISRWVDLNEQLQRAIWRQFALGAMPSMLKKKETFFYLFPLGKKAYIVSKE